MVGREFPAEADVEVVLTVITFISTIGHPPDQVLKLVFDSRPGRIIVV